MRRETEEPATEELKPETGALRVRAATAADMEALVELRFAFLQAFRHIGAEMKLRLEPELRGYFTRHLGRAQFVALLGFVGEEAVCTAFLTIAEGPPNDQYPNGLIGTVFNVYTVDAHRHKGYARLLMARLTDEARRLGVTAINLNASAAGLGLYESLGFATLKDTAMRLLIR